MYTSAACANARCSPRARNGNPAAHTPLGDGTARVDTHNQSCPPPASPATSRSRTHNHSSNAAPVNPSTPTQPPSVSRTREGRPSPSTSPTRIAKNARVGRGATACTVHIAAFRTIAAVGFTPRAGPANTPRTTPTTGPANGSRTAGADPTATPVPAPVSPAVRASERTATAHARLPATLNGRSRTVSSPASIHAKNNPTCVVSNTSRTRTVPARSATCCASNA